MPEYLRIDVIDNEPVYQPGTEDTYTHLLIGKDEYQGIINEYSRRIDIEKEYNRNLIRIATERANRKNEADKYASGYWVLRWRPMNYINKNRKGAAIGEYKLYSITFQTPLDCSLPLNVVDSAIMDALESGQIQLHDEITYSWNADMNHTIKDILMDLADIKDAIIIERRYQSNVVHGFWEVEFITNFEPQISPKHRKVYT